MTSATATMLSGTLASGAVAGLLLASGYGRRFDAAGRRNKLLASLPGGQTVVAASARAMCGVLDQVAVIVPSRSTLVEASLSDLPVRLFRNPRSREGMGASIAVGIAALEAEFPQARAWLIALGDMPFVAPKTIRAIAEAIGSGGHRIVAACYRGRRGHPVGFDRTLTAELTGLSGDVGASALIATHGVELIECNDPGVVRDIDTQEDLLRGLASAA